MTIHQFNTLKWIINQGWIYEADIRKCHQGNIASLAKHKWIVNTGRNKIKATEEGIRIFDINKYRLIRKHEADPTKRVMMLLHLGKILQMKRRAA